MDPNRISYMITPDDLVPIAQALISNQDRFREQVFHRYDNLIEFSTPEFAFNLRTALKDEELKALAPRLVGSLKDLAEAEILRRKSSILFDL